MLLFQVEMLFVWLNVRLIWQILHPLIFTPVTCCATDGGTGSVRWYSPLWHWAAPVCRRRRRAPGSPAESWPPGPELSPTKTAAAPTPSGTQEAETLKSDAANESVINTQQRGRASDRWSRRQIMIRDGGAGLPLIKTVCRTVWWAQDPSEHAPLKLGSSLVVKVRVGDASSAASVALWSKPFGLEPSEINGQRPSELLIFAAPFGVLSEYEKTFVQQLYYIDRKI